MVALLVLQHLEVLAVLYGVSGGGCSEPWWLSSVMAVEVLVCRYGGGERRPGGCEDCGGE